MILRSPFPDVEIPSLTLAEYLFEHAGRWPDAPALIDGPTGRTLTYRALRDLTRRVAAGLWARGVRKGDVICIFSQNLPEYAAVFLGASTIGVVSTTANPAYGAEELARQVRDSGARLIVTMPLLGERAREAAAAAGVTDIIVIGEATFAALVSESDAPPAVAIDPARDVVALPYSSGTTGLPKGVMLTHRNLIANLAQIDQIESGGPGESTIGFLPFFHIYGMTVVLCLSLRRGSCVVTIPKFDLAEYLRLSQEHRVRRAYIVPPVALALARQPVVDQYDLSSLEVIMSGAAPLSADLQTAVERRLRCTVKQGYGMTEASPVTHITPDDPTRVRPGSFGLLVPNTECRVVHLETGNDVNTGEHGELLIRGPQVMTGYLNHAEATAQAIDADGWLHTGDVGYADAEGYFFIVDRLKEFIKYKGLQVAPAELEALLLSHPCVADVAVIPIPDEEAGEVPKAFIVVRQDVGAADLMAFVASHVAAFKRVRSIEFIKQIPKSPSGKILRRELIARERALTSRIQR
jgi:acyl-CoA synthetase (AMP-forming)/AMP-acid ligase II